MKNHRKKWYKPWTWFEDSYIEEDVYEYREYVDLTKIREEFLAPIRFSLEENFNSTKDYAEREKNNLKAYFISEINQLEQLMKSRVQEIKQLASHSNELKERIEENKKKKQWLDNFVARLDSILDI
ncbi:putative GTPase [Anoxybacillus flavithermus]|uniref:Putative GTPase n=1 Tax=Anoxybacillus flavithermus TaxID=33934 RepID=A0A178TNR9_9BACL|nr:putative GTPase [Anoxybacillus flavithermus]